MLEILPTRSDSAAGNMASDFLLLKRHPAPAHARLRAYGWHRTAFSFGYSQKIDWVRARLPADAAGAELARRPTGGGLVDHRNDWTYALVIPRGHPLELARAIESYRAVHAALAAALRSAGQAAALLERCEAAGEAGTTCGPSGPGVCFERAELYDVISPGPGRKIAGAAQKRAREGLLFQGSVARAAAPGIGDFDALLEAFARALGETLGLPVESRPWPEYAEGEAEALTERHSSTEWLEQR
jgi:lipoate-protein ligase A